MNVGDRIKDLRIKKKLTQSDMAKKLVLVEQIMHTWKTTGWR
ncbi:helix-turn-helix transcriptional regulator [Paenibacillus larvae]|nr:helix-turn-helix transcriptional regulator [Paenibacillus larvae]MDT2194895.1 helix-turn-helix transcriptional regulator [Paenibacillus larvae]